VVTPTLLRRRDAGDIFVVHDDSVKARKRGALMDRSESIRDGRAVPVDTEDAEPDPAR
jgi:hypothetical protein